MAMHLMDIIQMMASRCPGQDYVIQSTWRWIDLVPYSEVGKLKLKTNTIADFHGTGRVYPTESWGEPSTGL